MAVPADIATIGARAEAMLSELGSISAEPKRLTRLYLTPEHRRAADLIASWMRDAGMTVTEDALGTVRGHWRPELTKRLLIGSHIDTVIDAGKYDGPLGVVAGILAVHELAARGAKLPFGIDVLAFGDEEGSRFRTTLAGSSASAGVFDRSSLGFPDRNGISLADAIKTYGKTVDDIAAAAYDPANVVGYVEVHIEQGPVLEAESLPLGIVTGIVGQSRMRVIVIGEAGHAGTVPMHMRHDALAGAAELMLLIEQTARENADDGMVATVGRIEASPGATNVIPGRVGFSLEFRSSSDAKRKAAIEQVKADAQRIGMKRRLEFGFEPFHETNTTACTPFMQDMLADAIASLGYKSIRLPSGAGHDAQVMAKLCPMAMLFVRCKGGISHNPAEFASEPDIGLAVAALVRFIEALAAKNLSGGAGMSDFVDANFPREVEFLKALVRVPSDNPPGDCDRHAEESARLLEGLGFTVERHKVPDEIAKKHGMVSATNLIVRETFGSGKGPVIAMNAHGDVVPPGQGWTHDPYGAEEVGGAIYGRGAAVSKSDYATYAFALLALKDNPAGLDGAVELHLTYDEETGGFTGPDWLLKQKLTKPDIAFSAGFCYAVVTAHNGVLHLEITVSGKQAHAAMPESGSDALEATTKILSAIYKERKRLNRIKSKSPGIGSPKITVGLISGGFATNVVPDKVVMRLDRRLTPEEKGMKVERDLIALVKRAGAGKGIKVACRRVILAEPLKPRPGVKRVVEIIQRHAKRELKVSIKEIGVPLYTDARHYSEAGIPTVLYGAGPRSILEANAHSANEHIKLSDLKAATKIVEASLRDLLKA